MRIVSWNVKGLRSPNKRMKILRPLKCMREDVALLQEAHLAEQDFQCLKKLWVGEVFGFPASGRRAGVIILLHNRLPYTLHFFDRDQEVGKLTIHLTIASKELAITNIYVVTSPGTVFFQDLSYRPLHCLPPPCSLYICRLFGAYLTRLIGNSLFTHHPMTPYHALIISVHSR